MTHLSDEQKLEIYRHSTAHLMAQAVKLIFPDAKFGIGPAISEGFYYDFDLSRSLNPEDLEEIENIMKKLIKEDHEFKRIEASKKDAVKIMKENNQPYKIELIEEIQDEKVTLYKSGDFIDLCRGPHLKSTEEIKTFKLLKIAGAYWRGDEKRQMLQRIYGTAFFTQREVDEYLEKIREAEKRDHRVLGPALDLFSIHPEKAGPGLIFYHPKGAILRHIIEDFSYNEHLIRGYQPVVIPHLSRGDLWKTSGHYDYYKENMFFSNIDEMDYVIKPMNCPGHLLIYKTKIRSFRDLPVRFFEFGTVYRYERSGVLHGLLRVRGFTQDDAHIFCTQEQLENEIISVIDFAHFMMKTFGFTYDIYLSTRPEKYVGTEENWEKATSALKKALENHNLKYEIDPGEGVFYGPKIDIKLKDALGRVWQGPTIQVDFNLPERFDLNYIGTDGQKHRPVMIHRVVLGSMERFVGALIEHYSGAFPLWISPVQVKILTISDELAEYARSICEKLVSEKIRVEMNLESEKIGYKIREAQMEKVPYMIILGKKEKEENKISVRHRKNGDLGQKEIDQFVDEIKLEIEGKS